MDQAPRIVTAIVVALLIPQHLAQLARRRLQRARFRRHLATFGRGIIRAALRRS